MNILLTGSGDRTNEFQKTISEKHSLVVSDYEELSMQSEKYFEGFDVFVDLNMDEFPQRILLYKNLTGKLVLGCAVKKSLAEITGIDSAPTKCFLAGINSLPDFISRKIFEISFLNNSSKEKFISVNKELNWNWKEVKDRAGMVTPRVIAMIINEACFELEEDTASRDDIDKGMKLGTAYPLGPLEWADRIGIKNVYETLDAIYRESADRRYRISPLLKKMYMQEKEFYS